MIRRYGSSVYNIRTITVLKQQFYKVGLYEELLHQPGRQYLLIEDNGEEESRESIVCLPDCKRMNFEKYSRHSFSVLLSASIKVIWNTSCENSFYKLHWYFHTCFADDESHWYVPSNIASHSSGNDHVLVTRGVVYIERLTSIYCRPIIRYILTGVRTEMFLITLWMLGIFGNRQTYRLLYETFKIGLIVIRNDGHT